MSEDDILKRLERAIAASKGTDKHVMIAAVREISRLRDEVEGHRSWWFYLTCHPEDSEKVAEHQVFGTPIETDHFGHVV